MRPIIIAMLAVQAAMLLAAASTIVFGRPATGRPRPIWSSLAVALAVVSGTSWRIADTHAGQDGADLLGFGAALLLGMALFAIFMAIRRRRGLD